MDCFGKASHSFLPLLPLPPTEPRAGAGACSKGGLPSRRGCQFERDVASLQIRIDRLYAAMCLCDYIRHILVAICEQQEGLNILLFNLQKDTVLLTYQDSIPCYLTMGRRNAKLKCISACFQRLSVPQRKSRDGMMEKCPDLVN